MKIFNNFSQYSILEKVNFGTKYKPITSKKSKMY